jgi:hypothetical protein
VAETHRERREWEREGGRRAEREGGRRAERVGEKRGERENMRLMRQGQDSTWYRL